MKRLFFIALCMFTFTSGLWAQSNKEDIDIIQSVYGKDKKELVAAYMEIPDAQKTAFWKLYDEYETKRKALGKKRMQLIGEYIDGYETLDNTKATKIALGTIANNIEYEKLHDAWFRKFSTVIGGKNAAKLFQLELYLQTVIRAEVMDALPFIGELSKKP